MTYKQLLERYLAKHKTLVEPTQGWGSLCKELHLAYSMGRRRGFTDLGTYVNKPLDHGGLPWARHPPAWAFDLGRKDRFYNRGWNYLTARRFAKLLWEHHEALNVEYLILGDHIISRNRPTWHYYGPDKSHFYHLHVSGHWPGRGEV